MIITLTTDFGLQDAFVGIMKGVIATINPQARVIDVTHGIPGQSIIAGALTLRHAAEYFPAGTIHVGVVDPGVGSTRLPLLIASRGNYFVGPDNGLFSLVVGSRDPDSITWLSNTDYHLHPTSATFHGRDIFAPVAAHLSRGVPVNAFGEKLAAFQRLEFPKPTRGAGMIAGEIIYIDHFGNLFTNITESDLPLLPGAAVHVTFGAGFHVEAIASSYTGKPSDEFVAVKNSWGLLEIAAPGGNAQQRSGANIGDPVSIEVEP